jgi:hypothetical protein
MSSARLAISDHILRNGSNAAEKTIVEIIYAKIVNKFSAFFH